MLVIDMQIEMCSGLLVKKTNKGGRTKLKTGIEVGLDIKKLLQKVGFYPKAPSFEIKGQGVNRKEKIFYYTNVHFTSKLARI